MQNYNFIRKSKFDYIVHLPEDYLRECAKEKQYPLFFALNEDDENIKEHSKYWKPDILLKNGFIIVYVQASKFILD